MASNWIKIIFHQTPKIKSAYDVTLAFIISNVILGFYLSMLSRRHFPYIEAHRARVSNLIIQPWLHPYKYDLLNSQYKSIISSGYFILKSLIWSNFCVLDLGIKHNYPTRILCSHASQDLTNSSWYSTRPE